MQPSPVFCKVRLAVHVAHAGEANINAPSVARTTTMNERADIQTLHNRDRGRRTRRTNSVISDVGWVNRYGRPRRTHPASSRPRYLSVAGKMAGRIQTTSKEVNQEVRHRYLQCLLQSKRRFWGDLHGPW